MRERLSNCQGWMVYNMFAIINIVKPELCAIIMTTTVMGKDDYVRGVCHRITDSQVGRFCIDWKKQLNTFLVIIYMISTKQRHRKGVFI